MKKATLKRFEAMKAAVGYGRKQHSTFISVMFYLKIFDIGDFNIKLHGDQLHPSPSSPHLYIFTANTITYFSLSHIKSQTMTLEYSSLVCCRFLSIYTRKGPCTTFILKNISKQSHLPLVIKRSQRRTRANRDYSTLSMTTSYKDCLQLKVEDRLQYGQKL